MSAATLLIPLLLIRFGLMAARDRGALRRAAHLAPAHGRAERIACGVYQLASAGALLAPFFLTVKRPLALPGAAGLALYLSGLTLCALAVVQFAAPGESDMSAKGVYRLSRNPMYIAYFLCFLGMALLSHAWIMAGIAAALQISGHWVILAEERWCLARFGGAYARYMQKVPRYL